MGNMPAMISDHGPEFAEATELIQGLQDQRFLDEAVEMARAAYDKYDPKVHRLVPRGIKPNDGELSYYDFFRQQTPELFRYCRNVGSAVQALQLLIERGDK